MRIHSTAGVQDHRRGRLSALAAVVLTLAVAAIALTACDTGTGGPVLVSISVTGPAKTSYVQGEAFSGAGLAVTAHYSNGMSAAVTSGVSLSWNGQAIADGDTAVTADPGNKTVTVGWQGRTASFTITIQVVAGNNFVITTTAEWNAAITAIKTGGNGKSYVLTIAGDFYVGPSDLSAFTFGDVNGLTVTLKGSGKLSLNANGALFFLGGSSASAQQRLVIDGPVTLEGRKTGGNGNEDNYAPVVLVFPYAALELKDGTITGNAASGVWAFGGSFTMTGGEISGNTVSGGVYTGGGGVYVTENGSFTMSGGKISGNTADNYGGGVFVYTPHSSFTMTGGEISGNTAGNGGGVFVNDGGVFAQTGGSFAKSGGTIYGDTTPGADENTATTGDGHAVYLLNSPKKRDTDAGPSVKLYAYYNGSSWTFNGGGVDGIGDTTGEWE